MWTFPRLLQHNRLIFRNLLRKSDAIVGCYDVKNRQTIFVRGKHVNLKNDLSKISRLFASNPVTECECAEPTSPRANIDRSDILAALNKFSQKEENRNLCLAYGIDESTQEKAFASFRRYCSQASENLPAEFHTKLYDIILGVANANDLFPYFIRHAQELFPHLSSINDLNQISDLTNPLTWYPQARSRTRKIIFHAGPTNSGKTYQAMQRFLKAKSGIYCGPLRLLAVEVYQKSNEMGTVCDLVTGQEKRFGNPDGSEANHIAVTNEMAPINRKFEVAIIDEIQLINDPERGWAWTRAILGIDADEVHVCGEARTEELLTRLCLTTDEIVEYNHYDRLTQLTIEDEALESFGNLQPGDCIVCFNRSDIYQVSRTIESMGKGVAVIYGSLPPNTKLAQAAKFNDPNDPCKILVATDAIGMGLNMSIKRIIFYSVGKFLENENGYREFSPLSVSQALQIAGRAGRFGTQWEHGYVTTFRSKHLRMLKNLLARKPEPITQAGLHPTIDQIVSYANHFPNSSLSDLMEKITLLSTVNDDLYFLCNTDDFMERAKLIEYEDVSLPLQVSYVYCCAPVNTSQPFVGEMLVMFANHHSESQPVTFDFVAERCGLPVSLPQSINSLTDLEIIFEVMELYLWLSYRFVDIYPHADQIRKAQVHLEDLIRQGLSQISRLFKKSRKMNLKVLPQMK